MHLKSGSSGKGGPLSAFKEKQTHTKDNGVKKMNELREMASRIKELREIGGKTTAEMARLTDVNERDYVAIEAGTMDPPFTFLHKCALAFGIDITALLEGHTAKLSHFQVNRAGQGPVTVNEQGILIRNMAAMFKGRLATPYFVTYDYDERQQRMPIHTTTHAGQEFDYVVSGSMRVKIGDHEETLNAGDSIFYKSSTPHGMIAVGGKKCEFLAMIMAGDTEEQSLPMVDGVSLHSFFSFPSGHTTTFFAIALVMSYLLTSGIQNKRTSAAVQALLFLFAAIGGYSRVYLSQHFAADVLGGCLIGTIITLLLCMLTDHYAINTAAWWSWCIGGSKRRTS